MSDAAKHGLEAVLDDVDAALARGLPADVDRYAAFDADGTLWDGDIGDTAFADAHAQGVVDDVTIAGAFAAWAASYGFTPAPHEPFRDVLARLANGSLMAAGKQRGLDEHGVKADLYGMQAWIYAGRTDEEIEAYGERVFQGGFEAKIFPGARRLIEGLVERGVDVVIVSASHRALVVPGGRRLGVTRERVIGMQPAHDDNGRTVTRIARHLYGPGKVRALAGRGRPLVACGDAVATTDRELLSHALLPVAVDPRGVHLDAAHALGARIITLL
jgi:phosphoserine phosphatase